MPEIIFDCSSLSNFALSDSLFILKNLYKDSAFITNLVLAEILTGIQQGHKNLREIQQALTDGWLQEIALKSAQEKSLYQTLSVSLGHGEASSMALAKYRGFVFACDDRAARRESGLLSVKLTGTLGILKKAIRNQIINLEKGNRILTEMIKAGFYSPVKSLNETKGP
jgi:predicted nucleic acid-binding protein